MKILLNCPYPFALAHGGQQIQIEQTRLALKAIGIEAEPLRWWDAAQRGDVIHFFGLPGGNWPDLVRHRGIKLIISPLLGGLGARSAWKRSLQTGIVRTALRTLPDHVLARIGWNVWGAVDACIAVTPWEAELMIHVFRAPQSRVHVVPNGVEDLFFQQPAEPRGSWLVTAASVLPVKRLVETAEAAVIAQTPYWVLGRPFSETDTCHQRLLALSRQHPQWVRYHGAMDNRLELARVFRKARGFVLLSRWESLSLSALEAAAGECPLLLSDLPWATSVFGKHASYCPITSPTQTAGYLRRFHDATPRLPLPPRPLTWLQVAEQLKSIYERVLSTSA